MAKSFCRLDGFVGGVKFYRRLRLGFFDLSFEAYFCSEKNDC